MELAGAALTISLAPHLRTLAFTNMDVDLALLNSLIEAAELSSKAIRRTLVCRTLFNTVHLVG